MTFYYFWYQFIGILAELYSFREKMPWALASGHAMGDDGPVSTAVSTLFNGISIGFKTPEVVEGLLPFEDALGDYTKWTDPAAVSVVWTQETPPTHYIPLAIQLTSEDSDGEWHNHPLKGRTLWDLCRVFSDILAPNFLPSNRAC